MASCQLYVMPASEGSPFALINGWRTKLNLPPLSRESLEREIIPVQIAGRDAIFTDMSTDEKRLYGIVAFTPFEYFLVEMSGPCETMESRMDEFMAFCASVKKAPSPYFNTGLFATQELHIQSMPELPNYESNQAGCRLRLFNGEEALGEVSLISDFPVHFLYQDRHYTLLLRKERSDLPFHIRLLSCKREDYPGTDIPRHYESRVQLIEGDDVVRDVRISMNRPLRYKGYTFYQHKLDAGKGLSVLSVVRNRAEKWPYFSCMVILLGMAVHFIQKLVHFLRKTAKDEK